MISDISGGEKNLGFRCIQLDYVKKDWAMLFSIGKIYK